MFAGTKITIEGEDFVVPALSLGQLRNGLLTKLREHDEIVDDPAKFFSLIDLRGQIILEALRRNYPDFDEARLFGWLDMSNIGPLWLSVLGQSGFTSGEVQAAQTAKVDGT